MGSATAAVSLLENADGSASYKYNGYEVLAAVNGPVEVQRRDELPDEAAIEVVLRPAAGVAGIRERHLEALIHRVLREAIRTKAHPRTLIQVTLQVMATPESNSASGRLAQAASNLPLLPASMNAALLALLTTTIPLNTTYAASFFAINADKSIVSKPRPADLETAKSVHTICLNRAGEVLLSESEGSFELEEWYAVIEQAKAELLENGDRDGPHTKGYGAGQSGIDLIRETVTSKLATQEAWRQPR